MLHSKAEGSDTVWSSPFEAPVEALVEALGHSALTTA